jgi:DNA modification methylase
MEGYREHHDTDLHRVSVPVCESAEQNGHPRSAPAEASARNTSGMANRLYYGDNLDVLRRGKIRDESVDLIYLDPPFNSQREYNVIFKEKTGAEAVSQQQAFIDSWDWSQAADTYDELLKAGGPLTNIMTALHAVFGPSNFLAYLSMMAARLVSLHRVLKPKGSIYLHCDPTASHYLKMIMDAVFGADKFRSEIVWKRSGAHNDGKQGRKLHGHIHDTLLFYTKGDEWTWNDLYTPYADSYVGRDYRLVEEETGRRFRRDNLTAARPGGDTEYDWRVKKHAGVRERWIADLTDEYLNPLPEWEYKAVKPYKGRYWAYSPKNMREFAKNGRLRHTFDGMPEYKRYLDEMPGVPLQDLWNDIQPIVAGAAERIGYPTQKPRALLERIIATSSNEGDVVLDPFCGCGTTIAAAEHLKRSWIGIDITARAIDIIISRLHRDFPAQKQDSYKVEQYPYSVPDAMRLADENKFHFQRWALEKLGVNPSDIKPGADKGIDGVLYFADGGSGRTKRVVLSVKAGGHVPPRDVRELRGVLDRDGFQIGVLVTAKVPSEAARADLATGVRYYTTVDGRRFRRLQALTVEDIFAGRGVEFPESNRQRTSILPGATPETLPELLRLDFEAEPVTLDMVKTRRKRPMKMGASEAIPKSKKPPRLRDVSKPR